MASSPRRRNVSATRRPIRAGDRPRPLEVLEARVLFAAVIDADGTLSLFGSTADVANVFTFARSGDLVVVTADGGPEERFAASEVRRVAVEGRGGNDSITFGPGFGGAVSPLPVTVDGGTGTSDSLVVNGSGGEDRVEVTPASVTVVPLGVSPRAA